MILNIKLKEVNFTLSWSEIALIVITFILMFIAGYFIGLN
jgi:hypothetical protein